MEKMEEAKNASHLRTKLNRRQHSSSRRFNCPHFLSLHLGLLILDREVAIDDFLAEVIPHFLPVFAHLLHQVGLHARVIDAPLDKLAQTVQRHVGFAGHDLVEVVREAGSVEGRVWLATENRTV